MQDEGFVTGGALPLPEVVDRRQMLGTLLLGGVGLSLGGCDSGGSGGGSSGTPAPTPSYTLSISATSVAPGQTGVVAQLTSDMPGALTFSKASGAAAVDVSATGAVALSGGLRAGEGARFDAALRNATGSSTSASFELKATVSVADLPDASVFVAGAAAGTALVNVPFGSAWTPAAAGDADKVRIDNGRLVVGATAAAAGVIDGTLSIGALSKPHRIRVLPALPLATGAKLMAFGHSFIANGAQQVYLASQTATNGHQGQTVIGRGVMNWINHSDGRFNTDVIPELAHPMFAPSSYYALSGALQGKGGDTIRPGVEAPLPTEPGSAPGSLVRTPYVLARMPDIIYLDMGINDVFRGVLLPDLIKAYDEQIARLTQGGAWVVLQTLSWVSTYDQAPADPRNAVIDGLNAWLLAQEGRPGVRVLNTLALDGPRSGIAGQAAIMFFDAAVHPSNRLAERRGDLLLALLRNMVTPGERRNLDPLAANLFPAAGLPGTAGTKSVGVTGSVATGMSVTRSVGASTLAASKAALPDGNEQQLITVTAVADATAIHTALMRMAAPMSLASLGMRPGDWLHILVPYETDDWAGWGFFDDVGRGPVALDAALYNGTNVSIFRASSAVSARNRSGLIETKLWWPDALAADSMRWNSNMLTLRWSGAAAGSGTVRIGSPILRRIDDPRPAWNLPS